MLVQVAFSAAAPLSLVYVQRIDYNVIKDNLSGVGSALDLLARHVRDQGLTEYVILLGDSVMYSGPGGPLQSVSRFMNDVAKEKGLPPVFNIAIPAAQMGDFYTLLLMLDERGISTDYVVMNLIYSGFVDRDPDPPIVYWLERDLERLDRETFLGIAPDLALSQENKDRPTALESYLEDLVYSRIPVLKYRDFLRAAIMKIAGVHPETTGDPRPWYEKPYIRDVMVGPVYERQFDPSPLSLDDSNLNVAFLEKIAQHQHGKRLLAFMSPLNWELTSEASSSPGFLHNMEILKDYLEGVAESGGYDYADLSSAMPGGMFSDHMHLVPDGYRRLAGILWERIEQENWFSRRSPLIQTGGW